MAPSTAVISPTLSEILAPKITLDRTSLDVAALMDTLAATGARAVVVLGTSFKPDGSNRSLRFAGKAATAAPHPYGAPGKNLTLLAAARPHQECGFIEKQRHGTFMHFFLQGLQGKADQNSDGRVSLAEAYHFARKNTEIQAFVDESRAQNPVLVGQDLDDLWLEPDSAP